MKELRKYTLMRGRTVHISSDEYMALNIDGEVCKVKEAVFEIFQKCIEVVIPI